MQVGGYVWDWFRYEVEAVEASDTEEEDKDDEDVSKGDISGASEGEESEEEVTEGEDEEDEDDEGKLCISSNIVDLSDIDDEGEEDEEESEFSEGETIEDTIKKPSTKKLNKNEENKGGIQDRSQPKDSRNQKAEKGFDKHYSRRMDKPPGLLDNSEISESSKKSKKKARRTGDLSGMVKNDLTGNNKDKNVKKRSKLATTKGKGVNEFCIETEGKLKTVREESESDE